MRKVLIVEGDLVKATALRRGLVAEGYQVLWARDAHTGVRLAAEGEVDLVVLGSSAGDAGEAGERTVYERLKGDDGGAQIIVPVRGSRDEPARGPWSEPTERELDLVEVIARVGAVLGDRPEEHETVDRVTFGDVEVNFRTHAASRGGRPLDLSSREIEILRFLVERRGRVVTREDLLRGVWGSNGASLTRTVDVHIAKLRKKIGDPTTGPRYIITVHRSGYKFVA
jgi:two-component system alkaline phosphatase synthesis response regulator PhoP